MSVADPWDEVLRLEDVLESDLFQQAKRSELHDAAESFCEQHCRVDHRCRFVETIESRADCPLWVFVRTGVSGP